MHPSRLLRRRTAIALGLACAGTPVGLACAGTPVGGAIAAPDTSLRELALRGVIRFGIDDDQLPFHGVEGGRMAGYEVDVATHIARRLGLQAQFILVRRAQQLAHLQGGQVDVLTGQFGLDQADGAPVRACAPYVYTRAQLLVRSPGRLVLNGVHELDGRRIGVLVSSVFEQIARQTTRGAVLAYPGQREMLHDLMYGKLNLVLAPSLTVRHYLRAHGPGPIKAGGRLGPPLQMALAVRARAAQLQHALNEVLLSAAEDGSLSRISHKWFEADVFAAPHLPPGG